MEEQAEAPLAQRLMRVVFTPELIQDDKKSRNLAYVVTWFLVKKSGLRNLLRKSRPVPPGKSDRLELVYCVNLTLMHIGSMKSEVHILGTDSTQGNVILQSTEKGKTEISFL